MPQVCLVDEPYDIRALFGQRVVDEAAVTLGGDARAGKCQSASPRPRGRSRTRTRGTGGSIANDHVRKYLLESAHTARADQSQPHFVVAEAMRQVGRASASNLGDEPGLTPSVVSSPTGASKRGHSRHCHDSHSCAGGREGGRARSQKGRHYTCRWGCCGQWLRRPGQGHHHERGR